MKENEILIAAATKKPGVDRMTITRYVNKTDSKPGNSTGYAAVKIAHQVFDISMTI